MKNEKIFNEKNLSLILIIGVITMGIILMSMSGCIGPKPLNETANETINETTNKTQEEQPPDPSEEIAGQGDTVEVNYIGKFENGTIFDESKGTPLQFTLGGGQMIAGFDESVSGMKEGETKTVTIPPEKAYGMPRSVPRTELVPLQAFVERVGKEPALNMEFNVQGVFWPMEVVAMDNETVTIKHNPTPNTEYSSQLKIFEVGETEMTIGHSLSGKPLSFEITLVEIMDECDAMGIPKRDTPEVNIFIMSYCPYGTQIEKGILPVQELLGSKADINIRFVHYLMHGQKEADENTVQYCIDKEQKDKFWSYLSCFLENGDSAGCLDRVGIDKDKLQSCTTSADAEFNISSDIAAGQQYPRYRVHEDLSKNYGVGGSPTFVINDKTIQTSRDSESLKKTICCAFNEKPAECSQTLSSSPPSPGFGFTGSGSGSAGTCG